MDRYLGTVRLPWGGTSYEIDRKKGFNSCNPADQKTEKTEKTQIEKKILFLTKVPNTKIQYKDPLP